MCRWRGVAGAADPSCCVLVDDSWSNMKAAKAAGWTTVLCGRTSRGGDDASRLESLERQVEAESRRGEGEDRPDSDAIKARLEGAWKRLQMGIRAGRLTEEEAKKAYADLERQLKGMGADEAPRRRR